MYHTKAIVECGEKKKLGQKQGCALSSRMDRQTVNSRVAFKKMIVIRVVKLKYTTSKIHVVGVFKGGQSSLTKQYCI